MVFYLYQRIYGGARKAANLPRGDLAQRAAAGLWKLFFYSESHTIDVAGTSGGAFARQISFRALAISAAMVRAADHSFTPPQ